MIEERKHLNYENILVQTGWTTSDERRTTGDLIEVFKMIKGLNKAKWAFFTIVQNSRTRGHRFKFVKNVCRSDVRKHIFSQRVVNEWNTLPEILIE